MKKETSEQNLKVRRNTYSGKGRPKKTDYITVKPEQVRGKNSIKVIL